MRLVFKNGSIEIWEVKETYGFDFYVYGIMRDAVICPSLDMARAKIAGY